MLIAYILDYKDLHIKQILEPSSDEILHDIDFADKSTIVVNRPDVENRDFVIVKDGSKTLFQGIAYIPESSDSTETYDLQLRQFECLFDSRVFIDNENLLATGIEDFVKEIIEDNWTDSGDMMDLDYLTVVCDTHTPCSAKVASIVTPEGGTFNLKTFLGNAKQYYGLFVKPVFTDGALTVHLYSETTSALDIDVTLSDISGYTESYEVDVLARLWVEWLNNGSRSVRKFYLKTDRTITTNQQDPNRADGTFKCITVETDAEDDMVEQAKNEFASNKYSHKVGFRIRKDSEVYDTDELYVGRRCRFKTKNGIKESIITSRSESAGNSFVALNFGTLRITLIDKIREVIKK